MNYTVFRNKFHCIRLFSINDIKKWYPNFDSRRLVEWQEKGYIRKVINRWYIFEDVEINDNMKLWIANRIFQPSYISLESAFSLFNLIPELVYTTTSITTNKTISFDTFTGYYAYRHVKPNLFFGYTVIEWQGFPQKIAELEKSLLDYLYLNTHLSTIKDFESIRFNTKEIIEKIDLEKFNKYLSIYENKALTYRAKLLTKYLGLC